jgi:hypothetical protein
VTTRWFLAFVAIAGACGNSPDIGGVDGGAADTGAPAPVRSPNLTCHAPARAVPVGSDGLPGRLSETGCFQPPGFVIPASGVMAYTVNAPLWSDGAEKDRWLALPDSARVRIGTDGDLDLPPGSVTIKTFSLGGRRVETRFFVRHEGGAWSGYNYQWNEAETDAVLLSENGGQRMLGDPQLGRVRSRRAHRVEVKQVRQEIIRALRLDPFGEVAEVAEVRSDDDLRADRSRAACGACITQFSMRLRVASSRICSDQYAWKRPAAAARSRVSRSVNG